MKEYFWKRLEEPDFESDSGRGSTRTVMLGEERKAKAKDRQRAEKKEPQALGNEPGFGAEDSQAFSPCEENQAGSPKETVEKAECTILAPKADDVSGTAEDQSGDLPEMKDDCQ